MCGPYPAYSALVDACEAVERVSEAKNEHRDSRRGLEGRISVRVVVQYDYRSRTVLDIYTSRRNSSPVLTDFIEVWLLQVVKVLRNIGITMYTFKMTG